MLLFLIAVALLLILLIGFLHVYNGTRDGDWLRTLAGFAVIIIGTPAACLAAVA